MTGSKPVALPLGDTPTFLKPFFQTEPNNTLCAEERLVPFAINAFNSAGSLLATIVALFSEAKLKKTQAPVPVILAEPNLFSKFNVLPISGLSFEATY